MYKDGLQNAALDNNRVCQSWHYNFVQKLLKKGHQKVEEKSQRKNPTAKTDVVPPPECCYPTAQFSEAGSIGSDR
jgi:hypothetical protein